MRNVITCDADGKETGTCPVADAHANNGILHKAFSVFVFRNGGNELLLQRRSDKKQLFPLLWTNTCCSHPQPGEDPVAAAQKRLQEELGFSCPLREIGSFVYQATDPSGNGAEHEYDTVLMGNVEEETALKPDPNEVEEVRWITLEELLVELDEKPEQFTPWFPEALALLFDT
ncbi:MAG: isopentenyl-diphosphate Delta-isomerase [Candidatus Peribacteraceae bacterium]|nr:isopentenyl-diphosphate Delta-isomerase [Candidatus Peribacteraceae bacterium]